MTRPEPYDRDAARRSLPPPAGDAERIRVADLLAHDKAWLRDKLCPVAHCTRCPPPQDDTP